MENLRVPRFLSVCLLPILVCLLLWGPAVAAPAGAAASERPVESPSPPADGPFQTYGPDGDLQATGYLVNGKKEGLFKRYYPNGQVMLEVEYRAGQPSGRIRTFTSDGRVLKSWDVSAFQHPHSAKKVKPAAAGRHFVKFPGRNYRLVKDYYQSGSLKTQRLYRDSVLNGRAKEYDEDGRLIFLDQYEGGELQQRIDLRPEALEQADLPDGIKACFRTIAHELDNRQLEALAVTSENLIMRHDFSPKNDVSAIWTQDRFADFFRARGIYHPDDMGNIALVAFHRYLNGKQIQLDDLIAVHIQAPNALLVFPEHREDGRSFPEDVSRVENGYQGAKSP